MAGSTAYRLTEPALADSLSRACYRGVTNLRRVYLLNGDQPDRPGRNLPCITGRPGPVDHDGQLSPTTQASCPGGTLPACPCLTGGPWSSPSHADSHSRHNSALIAVVVYPASPLGCRGDGVVDEDGGDGGGGGEGVGVEDPGAGRGAIEEQRQLLAELFGVGGAGFAGGLGEPRGDGFLVVACVLGCGVLRVRDLDGRRDEGAQGRDVPCPGRGRPRRQRGVVRGA